MDGFTNHYRTLKIESTADGATIKAAFRRLALRHHPDRAATLRAARRFQAIREAYEVLSDPDRRRAYDRVYRAQTALRPTTGDGGSPGSRGQARSGRLGISLDLLGLRVGIAVDAAASRVAVKNARTPRRK